MQESTCVDLKGSMCNIYILNLRAKESLAWYAHAESGKSPKRWLTVPAPDNCRVLYVSPMLFKPT